MLKLSQDGYSLESFLGATIHVTNQNPEIFFRFAGNADLAIVQSIETIVNALMRNEPKEAVELIKPKLSDNQFISNLKESILSRIRSKSVGRPTKLNMLSSTIKLNSIEESKDLDFIKFSGAIVERVPEELFRGAASVIDPVIWSVALKRGINQEKTQSIARFIYSELKNHAGSLPSTDDLKMADNMNRIWGQIGTHLIAISQNWELFEQNIQNRFRDILLQFLSSEVLEGATPTQKFWEWVMPEKGEFPEIVKDSELLYKLSAKIPKNNTEQVRRAGLLLAKLHEYSGNKAFYQPLENLTELFNKEYTPKQPELYPLNIAKEWILECNRIFNSSNVDTVFKAIIKNAG